MEFQFPHQIYDVSPWVVPSSEQWAAGVACGDEDMGREPTPRSLLASSSSSSTVIYNFGRHWGVSSRSGSAVTPSTQSHPQAVRVIRWIRVMGPPLHLQPSQNMFHPHHTQASQPNFQVGSPCLSPPPGPTHCPHFLYVLSPRIPRLPFCRVHWHRTEGISFLLTFTVGGAGNVIRRTSPVPAEFCWRAKRLLRLKFPNLFPKLLLLATPTWRGSNGRKWK